MKVFLAGLCHETSSFSPIPTDRRSFESSVYQPARGGALGPRWEELNGYAAFARAALADGHEVHASAYAQAQPSGPCVRRDYEALRDEILDDLRGAGDVSLVLLFLHGAQMAEGYPDCEGDLLARVREAVGPEVFVGALLDLHANVTRLMVESASALVACRLYPHTDFDERAAELYRIGVEAARRRARPAMRFLPVPIIGMFYTTEPLMAAANAAALDLQGRPGVLSVSLIHGFMLADIPEMGAGVLVVAERGAAVDDGAVEAVGAAFFAARSETRALRRPVGPILDLIEAASPDGTGRPFVVADACDNPGGGTGSDSTFILDAILSRGLRGYALALLWDPAAASLAASAGEGSTPRLRLGGKTGPEAGRPLDVEARVLAVRHGLVQRGIGFAAPSGLNVALEVAGNVVVVNDTRGQVFSPTCFTDVGVEPGAMKALVVKSSQHFHAQFAPLARAVLYCETPGGLALDIDPTRYRNLRRPVWPLDDVAFPAAA